MKPCLKKTVSACAIAAACLGVSVGAQAQETHHGVTFTPSFSGNVLTLEIDAANPTDTWANAVALGALQVKLVGSFTSFTFSGPGAAAGWTTSPNELSATGCDGGSSGVDRACAFGTPVPLTDNMIFTYTFTGGPLDLTFPEVKVNFIDANGEQVGAVSVGRIHAVPEPSTYAMLAGGLALVGVAARRRARKSGKAA